jgi:hypothetical protein
VFDRILTGQVQINQQPDIYIDIRIPNEFQQIGKINIGITAGVETSAVSQAWIDGCNKMDLIIVPSEHSKYGFINSTYDKIKQTGDNKPEKIGELKVEKPIEVLFEGADTEIYKPTKEFSKDLVDTLEVIEENFCFLFVGHWLQGPLGYDRKDLGMLVKTFLETFKSQPKQPALILKTSGATPCILDREDILTKINEIKDTVNGKLPNVYVLHGDLRDEEMNGLYNHPKVKAHVSFTHGEGFGRPLLEASLSEKPVIAPNWSGHVDFLDPKLSILLSGEMNKTPREAFPRNIWTEGSEWFTVNYPNSSKVLMDVYKNLPLLILPCSVALNL